MSAPKSVELSEGQKAEMAALAKRRPDLVEQTEQDDGPHWQVTPDRLARLAAEDTEGVRVATECLRVIAPVLSPVPLSLLVDRLLPLLERAAVSDPFLARDLAASLERTDFPKGFEAGQRSRRVQRRLQAMADGSCGCAETPIPYRDPAKAPLLEEMAKRELSREGVITVLQREMRCVRCGARFRVAERIDYDRHTYRWARLR